MCCTTDQAELNGTKILSLPLSNGNHFIAYANSVRNSSGKPNAMILAIPGKAKPEWFHDTTKYNTFLDDIIHKASLSEWLGLGWRTRGAKLLSEPLGDSLKSFDKFDLGIYTVGLAGSFDGIADFLASLPDEKRPEIGKELQDFFKGHYPDWSFAVCCFDSKDAMDSQPIAFEYAPMDPNLLYFPTMDAHDGGAPKLNEDVYTDHTFIFEHTGPMDRKYVMDSIELKGVPGFLDKRKYRIASMHGFEPNGDTVVEIDAMAEKEFSIDPDFLRASSIFDRSKGKEKVEA